LGQRARLDVESDGGGLDVVIVDVEEGRQVVLLNPADGRFFHRTAPSGRRTPPAAAPAGLPRSIPARTGTPPPRAATLRSRPLCMNRVPAPSDHQPARTARLRSRRSPMSAEHGC